MLRDSLASSASAVENSGPVARPEPLRIRLHGRGGHGVKTAGRILGSAAFLAGFSAQDSPIYGAERRGAAVASFVRIGARTVSERGPIARPDLLVLADETLLRDPAAGVLAGQEGASALFVNSTNGSTLAGEFSFLPALQTYDLSGRTKEILGRAAALSAGLGAAAARLAGLIPLPTLLDAMRHEFEDLALRPGEIDKNLRIGEEVYAALRPAVWRAREGEAAGRLVRLTQASPRTASPSILHPGNAEARQTGAWRVDRPTVDRSACTRCGLCFVMCPDGAIQLDEHGYPVVDYDHCKGCMICQRLCPVEAIAREKETRAW